MLIPVQTSHPAVRIGYDTVYFIVAGRLAAVFAF